MSQRRQSDRRNKFKNYESYGTSFEFSRDFDTGIKSNFHSFNSRKVDDSNHLKSPSADLYLDSERRKYFNYIGKNGENHSLNHNRNKKSRNEKNFYSENNKFSKEDRQHEEHFGKYSKNVNNSIKTRDLWKEETRNDRKKKNERNRGEKNYSKEEKSARKTRSANAEKNTGRDENSREETNLKKAEISKEKNSKEESNSKVEKHSSIEKHIKQEKRNKEGKRYKGEERNNLEEKNMKEEKYMREEINKREERNNRKEKNRTDFSKFDTKSFTFDQKIEEIEKCYLEGSARTRGFYHRRKKSRHRYKKETFENCKSQPDNRNSGNINKLKNTELSEYQAAQKPTEDFNYKNERKMRKEKFSANSSSMKESARTPENSKQNYSIIRDNSLQMNPKNLKSGYSTSCKNISNENYSPKSNESIFSKSYLKRPQFPEENKTKCENEEKKINDEQTVIFNNSEAKDQKIEKTKIQAQTKKPQNYESKKMCLLMHLIRKLIVSYENNKHSDPDNEAMKSDDEVIKNDQNYNAIDKNDQDNTKTEKTFEQNKKQFTKIESFEIQRIRTGSSCESSGYDSLKNIPEHEIIANKHLEHIFKANKDFLEFSENSESTSPFEKFLNQNPETENLKNIEFVDSRKYCLYKIYKSQNGGILLKESQSLEFDKGEFTEKEKNDSNFCKLRNNSTQTELNILTSKKITRKPSWFRKTKKTERRKRPTKYLAPLESTSDSSFAESSDFENLKFRKKRKAVSLKKKYSSSSKYPVSHNKSVEILKKSAAVDTSDLNCTKNAEKKIILLFDYTENEKSSLEISRECKFFNSVDTSIGRMKLNEVETKIGSQNPSVGINSFFIDKSSVIVPVSSLNSEHQNIFPKEKKVDDLLKVENSRQDESQIIKKPETKNLDYPKKKKKSRAVFRIFNRKKK